MNRKNASGYLESALVVILFVVGIALRIYCMGNVEQNSVYFELTKVAEDRTIPSVVHGAVYIYLQLLHLVYFVFGNKFMAGIWLQIVLQMFSGGFVYFAIRKMAGVIPALVMLGFLMLSPFGINQALILSPEFLFLFVFAIVLCVCAKCICDRKRFITCGVTGAFLSVACYLDIIGCVLVVLTVAGILLVKNPTTDSVKKRLIAVLFCILSSVAGFIVLMAIDSFVSAKKIGSVIWAWCKIYTPSGFDFSVFMNSGIVSIELMILLIMIAIGIFSFWFVRRTEYAGVWVLAVLALLLLQCFGMTTEEVSGTMQLYIVLSVLAGISVKRLFARKTVEAGSVWEEGKLEAQLEAMSRDVGENFEEPLSETEQPHVQLIENPLPLPKKHVKKVMDFDRELDEESDDFDVDVDENDDFDI